MTTTSSPVCKLCGETDPSKFRQRIIDGKTYYVRPCRLCEKKVSLAYFHTHREERLEYQKTYIAENKDVIKTKKKEYDKERYPLIKEEKIAYVKDWAKTHRDIVNINTRSRRANDPVFKLRSYISGRIAKIIRQGGHKKKGSCIKHLDYTFLQLKEHIEKQFEPWMNWNNQGVYDPQIWDDGDSSTWVWNIDHIIPQSDLPYTSMTDDNFKKCWALSNLRPLSAKQNILEGTSRKRHAK